MTYRAIGLMSGSSLDGLDIIFAEFQESAGLWQYEIRASECQAYPDDWRNRLQSAHRLNAFEYLCLHADYGHYLAEAVTRFMERFSLSFQVQLIGSHGHTVYHAPSRKMTSQLGDGAALAAGTGINVVSDLRNMDIALGGQGAPIVPIGERLLFPGYAYFLNIGGIANLSVNFAGGFQAFDVCAANRVLNQLIEPTGRPYDEGGRLAAGGTVQNELLDMLGNLSYYQMPAPKSLSNDFGTDVVYPLVRDSRFSLEDQLSTYAEHIALQVKQAIEQCPVKPATARNKMLVTGGGAHHLLLRQRLTDLLAPIGITVEVPDSELVDFKEALIMALIGVLRWREEDNVLASVTGARRNSIGGAVWIGQDA